MSAGARDTRGPRPDDAAGRFRIEHMNGTDITPAQRRLPRETRNLLIAACVALIALWILARLRFPDQPVTPNPISPVLTQMSTVPGFAELASEVTRVRNRVGGAVLALSAPGDASGDGRRAALRVRPDAAVTLLRGRDPLEHGPELLAADPASGLAIVRVRDRGAASAPVPWAPVRLDTPRFLMMTTATPDGLSLEPVFVGALAASPSPAWSGPIWLLPAGTDVAPGALLFTSDGELVGLAVEEEDRVAVVPGETLLADATRLIDHGVASGGDLGIRAQPLSEPLAAATQARTGVVVTWVEPGGPAARHLRPGDVIEMLNSEPLESLREWQVRSRRIAEGQAVALAIWRGGMTQSIEIVAARREAAPERPLGLTLRFITDVGSEVVRVDPGSAAEAAGIERGDIITVAGTIDAPTPARIRLAFAATEATAPLLVALTRGTTHHVTALAR